MGVFQQRRRAHGNGRLDSFEESEEVSNERIGQLGSHEVLENLLVRSIAEGDSPEIVLVHELIEDVGTEHNGLGNLHGSILELIEFRMALDDIVEERQATAFATQRAIANAGKVGIAVELETVEDSHNTNVLHATILHDGIEDNLAMGIDILQLVPCNRFQELRHGEDGTSTKPATHVVA